MKTVEQLLHDLRNNRPVNRLELADTLECLANAAHIQSIRQPFEETPLSQSEKVQAMREGLCHGS